jgi:hypothetical protein
VPSVTVPTLSSPSLPSVTPSTSLPNELDTEPVGENDLESDTDSEDSEEEEDYTCQVTDFKEYFSEDGFLELVPLSSLEGPDDDEDLLY